MKENFKELSFNDAVSAYSAMKYCEKGVVVCYCIDASGLSISTWKHIIAAWVNSIEYSGDNWMKRRIFTQAVGKRLKEKHEFESSQEVGSYTAQV